MLNLGRFAISLFLVLCVLAFTGEARDRTQTATPRADRQPAGGSSNSPACLNEEGQPVDWYIAYKFPALSDQKRPFDTGFAYAYITSDKIKRSTGQQNIPNVGYSTYKPESDSTRKPNENKLDNSDSGRTPSSLINNGDSVSGVRNPTSTSTQLPLGAIGQNQHLLDNFRETSEGNRKPSSAVNNPNYNTTVNQELPGGLYTTTRRPAGRYTTTHKPDRKPASDYIDEGSSLTSTGRHTTTHRPFYPNRKPSESDRETSETTRRPTAHEISHQNTAHGRYTTTHRPGRRPTASLDSDEGSSHNSRPNHHHQHGGHHTTTQSPSRKPGYGSELNDESSTMSGLNQQTSGARYTTTQKPRSPVRNPDSSKPESTRKPSRKPGHGGDSDDDDDDASDPDWVPPSSGGSRDKNRQPNSDRNRRPSSTSANSEHEQNLYPQLGQGSTPSSVESTFEGTTRRPLGQQIGGLMSSLFHRNTTRSRRYIAPDTMDNSQWIISQRLITDPQSLIMQTLGPVYQRGQSGNPNSIFYNDQPPKENGEEGSSSNSRAHAKGVVLIDDISGRSIWLTHSTPQFPPARGDRLEFHENAKHYGQTFMCISFDVRQSGQQIVDHLVNMFPMVYDSHISERLYTTLPDLKDLKLEDDNSRRRNRGNTNKLSQKITSVGGETLQLFSKSSNFGQDLYSDWMENELKSSLYVATWRRGSGTPLNSSCPRNSFHVNNVQDFQVIGSGDQVKWSHMQDHSKWAISEESQHGVVCISDINRMESQFKRGGGAVCFRCPGCWNVFSKTILDIETCPIQGKPKPSNRKRRTHGSN